MARPTKKTPADDLLDWTITHAPADDEPPPAPLEQPAPGPLTPPPSWEPPPLNWIRSYMQGTGAASHPRKISRQIGLLLGGFIVVSLLGMWLYPIWNQSRLRRDMAHIVSLEDQAALSGDVDQLHQLAEDGDGGWLSEQDQLATLGQVVSPPTRLLLPVREPGVVQSLTLLAANVARVDVARKFTASDGTTLTFSLPQFYHFTSGAWKRIPLPDDALGEQLTRTTAHTDLQYYAADADFVEKDLGPYLDDVLARACAAWDCPDDFKITISFDGKLPASQMFHLEWGDGLLLFQLSPVNFSRWPHDTLLVGSPSAVGYPANTASADYLRRVIATQALFVAADQITFSNGAQDPINNPFFYALVARMTAWLGLDSPHVIDRYATPSTRTADAIWHSDPFFVADDSRRALAMLNWLLRDQPAQAEILLFRALGSKEINNPVDWLAAGLNISEDEARARLDAAATSTYRLELDYSLAALPPAHYDLALGCDRGPVLLSLSAAQPVYFLPDYHASANILSWSPDGQRLVVDLSGQPAVVDFAARTVYALPQAAPGNLVESRWASDTLVAYVLKSASDNLLFFDTANPQASIPSIVDIHDYVPSPDKARAAVVTKGNRIGDYPPEVALMPITGGPLTFVDNGQSPSWSPDGKALVYAYTDATRQGFALHLADVMTGITRTLVTSANLGLSPIYQYAQTAWSPTGEKIAFTTNGNESFALGIVNADGSDAKLLLHQGEYGDPPRFSADGKFLASVVYGLGAPPTAVIYDTITGVPVASLPRTWDYDWSPTDHQLVVVAFDGVYLLAEPGDPHSPMKKLLNGACYSARWNPAP